jgi:L-Ala-D/L-Glu epimerase / N-acetyl-D-glutamate racemase
MGDQSIGPMAVRARIERWPLAAPFSIAGRRWEFVEVIVVTLEKDDKVGRGEAAGVYYKNEHAGSMLRQIESTRTILESGISRASLQKILPVGRARNALDCAFWELEARLTGGIPTDRRSSRRMVGASRSCRIALR